MKNLIAEFEAKKKQEREAKKEAERQKKRPSTVNGAGESTKKKSKDVSYIFIPGPRSC